MRYIKISVNNMIGACTDGRWVIASTANTRFLLAVDAEFLACSGSHLSLNTPANAFYANWSNYFVTVEVRLT
jgi:hypothetical protein